MSKNKNEKMVFVALLSVVVLLSGNFIIPAFAKTVQYRPLDDLKKMSEAELVDVNYKTNIFGEEIRCDDDCNRQIKGDVFFEYYGKEADCELDATDPFYEARKKNCLQKHVFGKAGTFHMSGNLVVNRAQGFLINGKDGAGNHWLMTSMIEPMGNAISFNSGSVDDKGNSVDGKFQFGNNLVINNNLILNGGDPKGDKPLDSSIGIDSGAKSKEITFIDFSADGKKSTDMSAGNINVGYFTYSGPSSNVATTPKKKDICSEGKDQKYYALGLVTDDDNSFLIGNKEGGFCEPAKGPVSSTCKDKTDICGRSGYAYRSNDGAVVNGILKVDGDIRLSTNNKSPQYPSSHQIDSDSYQTKNMFNPDGSVNTINEEYIIDNVTKSNINCVFGENSPKEIGVADKNPYWLNAGADKRCDTVSYYAPRFTFPDVPGPLSPRGYRTCYKDNTCW